MKKILAAICAMALIFTGCSGGDEQETTTAAATEDTTLTAATAKPLQEGDAYAVDKLDFAYMPDGWVIAGKYNNQMVIAAKDCQVDIQGINYKETLQDIDAFADSCMAVLAMNNMLYHSDMINEEPYHTTIGEGGYDAVVYDFTIVQNEYVTGTDGLALKNPDGSEQKYEAARYGEKGVFFYSGKDAYYMIFQCEEKDFERLEPEFNELLKSLVVHEDYRAADTSEFTTPTVAEDLLVSQSAEGTEATTAVS
jgi:hypothetical protein